MSKIKLYIARDSNYFFDDDYEREAPGEIHLFYDTPILIDNSHGKEDENRKGDYIWSRARMIGTVPNYMFPELKEKTCMILEDTGYYKES